MKNMNLQQKTLEKIAKEHCHVETLQTRNSDGLDFHEVSVWGLKAALEKAYSTGAEHALCQTISPELLIFQRRLTACADEITLECRRQLPHTGRAELCLEEVAHRHGLDFHGNQAIWDIVVEAIAEDLDGQELDMELDNGALIFTCRDLPQLEQQGPGMTLSM